MESRSGCPAISPPPRARTRPPSRYACAARPAGSARWDATAFPSSWTGAGGRLPGCRSAYSPRRGWRRRRCRTASRWYDGAVMAEWTLGIETSCDETSAAVLRQTDGRAELAGLSILSQDVHRIFGGVVPELASRAHVQVLGAVV